MDSKAGPGFGGGGGESAGAEKARSVPVPVEETKVKKGGVSVAKKAVTAVDVGPEGLGEKARAYFKIPKRLPLGYRTVLLGWLLFLPQYLYWTIWGGVQQFVIFASFAFGFFFYLTIFSVTARRTFCPSRKAILQSEAITRGRRRSVIKGTGKRVSIGHMAFDAVGDRTEKKRLIVNLHRERKLKAREEQRNAKGDGEGGEGESGVDVGSPSTASTKTGDTLNIEAFIKKAKKKDAEEQGYDLEEVERKANRQETEKERKRRKKKERKERAKKKKKREKEKMKKLKEKKKIEDSLMPKELMSDSEEEKDQEAKLKELEEDELSSDDSVVSDISDVIDSALPQAQIDPLDVLLKHRWVFPLVFLVM